MKNYISIIIPALNEEHSISKTIRSIPFKDLKSNDFDLEIIVVDNNSTDNTAKIAEQMGAKVIKEINIGYGHAYKTGFLNSSGDVIIMCDADNQYPIYEINNLLNIFFNQKLDFLTTNRFNRTSKSNFTPFSKKIGNRILTLIFNILYGITIKDSQSGLMIIKKDLINNLNLYSNQMNFSEEIKIESIFYQKCRWTEIDISCIKRTDGYSKTKIVKHGLDNLLFLFKKRISR